MKASTDTDAPLLSWPECARLCKSASPQPHTSIAFVWGQSDHVLRRFFETTALPHLRKLRIEEPTWEGGPGELFLGLAALGSPLEEMVVTTSLNHAKTRCVTFRLSFDAHGQPVAEYSFPLGPLSKSEIDDAVIGMGIPTPARPARSEGRF